jgi:hypothetical protein
MKQQPMFVSTGDRTMKTKKPYSKPKLTIHGDVSKITLGGLGGDEEGVFGGPGGFGS